jgi:DNA-binding SARP family transcriptional activator
MLEVRLIGKFDIQCGGKPVVLRSRAAQSLLAYLILTAGTLHRREKLAGMLWPDESEQKARTYLRNELWRIRKALPSNIEYFVVDNLTIGFNQSAAYWLDIATLQNVSDNAGECPIGWASVSTSRTKSKKAHEFRHSPKQKIPPQRSGI